jgi:hypothetical protein
MCFDTTKHQKPKFATEDIECWKVIKSNGYAYHRKYKYVIGAVQPRVIIRKCGVDSEDDAHIFEGYHSYTNIKKAGNHRPNRSYIVSRFIIPKGTRYFHNIGDNEYVAEVIKRVPYKK